MKKFLKDWKFGNDIGILILRLVLGFSMFYGHGLGKWKRLISGDEIKFANPLGIGEEISFYLVLFAEGICVFFLMLGLFTRFSLIPLLIAMYIAAFVFHGGQPFGNFENPMLYFFGFLALFFTGAGKFSLDRIVLKK